MTLSERSSDGSAPGHRHLPAAFVCPAQWFREDQRNSIPRASRLVHSPFAARRLPVHTPLYFERSLNIYDGILKLNKMVLQRRAA
jgi:hypothetical protein